MPLNLSRSKILVKKIAQCIIAQIGPHKWPNTQPKLWIIMYHRVLPANDPRALLEEPGMFVTPEDLEMHIKTIKQHFTIVSLNQWISARKSGKKLPTKSCVLTFDDGWLDNYEHAWPILKKHNTPATIYLVTNCVGSNYSFWTNRLAQIVIKLKKQNESTQKNKTRLDKLCSSIPKSLSPADYISKVIHAAKQLPEPEAIDIVKEAEKTFAIDTKNSSPDLMSWSQIKELNNSPLIDFGSHTENHIKLSPDYTDSQIRTEIINSKKRLEKELSSPIVSFSYPYGAFTDLARETARAHYSSATTTVHGINSTSTDLMELKRIRVHSDISNTPYKLLSRLSGWM